MSNDNTTIMEEEKEEELKDTGDHATSFDYIFGYGSIMNTSTHAAWQKDTTAPLLAGQRAMLHNSPYRRAWNFRSSTGFTALGLTTTAANVDACYSQMESEASTDTSSHYVYSMNGVLFRIPHSVLADFDRREVGYDRVALPLNQVQLIVAASSCSDNGSSTSSKQQQRQQQQQYEFDITDQDRLWIYVPQPAHVALADPNHPILQSYVDTVLQGCLEWGGRETCREFIVSTRDWSRLYYLNDIPHSRRPWLHRCQDYPILDALLQEYSHITHVHQARRHPEDFAVHRVATETAAAAAAVAQQLHSSGKDVLRGAWSLPQRNPVFVGRSRELQEIHCRLLQQQQQQQQPPSSSSTTSNSPISSSSNNNTTIATLQVAGMGGVGKTQLVAEYCHLHVHDYYGLVLWLRASSAESVAAGYRQFMTDCILQTNTTTASTPTAVAAGASNSGSNGTTASMAETEDVKEMDNNNTPHDLVIAEVKARLFRSKVPWLLVFDNLEDFSLLPKFVPNGGTIKGHHVIVTTRLLHAHESSTTMANAYNNTNQQQPVSEHGQRELYYDTMILQCFQPEESIQLLARAGGFSEDMQQHCNGSSSSPSPSYAMMNQRRKHVDAAKDLAERLGHLPLALGMAAAYMRQCDVDCCEYLSRYVVASSSSSSSSSSSKNSKSSNSRIPNGSNRSSKKVQGLNVLGHDAVSSSLFLSLKAIRRENEVAWEMLRLLSWLGPDQITKKLVRSLLVAKRQEQHEKEETLHRQATTRSSLSHQSVGNDDTPVKWMLSTSLIIATTVGAVLVATLPSRHKSIWRMGAVLGIVSISTSLATLMLTQSSVQRLPPPSRSSSSSSLERSIPNQQVAVLPRIQSFSGDIYQQTDLIWKILKSFSLLQVKEGKASMHRLLGQFLRLSQSDADDDIDDAAHFNICACFKAILEIWSFKPELVDTWHDATLLLEHVKTLVTHAIEHNIYRVEIAILAQEAGVFSAMALNRFQEAQDAIEQSLRILDALASQSVSATTSADNLDHEEARGAALHELGRVFRYEGKFLQAEQALSKALEIRNYLAGKADNDVTLVDARSSVASTLHELGVLEVKKHNLDSATVFLRQALELRCQAALLDPSSSSSSSFPTTTMTTIEADCASTLHQLAAVEVARKPPALDKAEVLLKEALGLNMQIGQRAATLKQLARVAIRRGEFHVADASLVQALELYAELYGENSLHINVAAVRFQQGALAFQREQLVEAWTHFSECLRARRHVYDFSQGNHLEVSTVIHELGCVAFAQKCITKAREMLEEEKGILDQLFDSTSNHQHRQRLLQARLTNLTWLRKCAKENGEEEETRRLATERSELRRKEHDHPTQQTTSAAVDTSPGRLDPRALSLQQEVVRCRLTARRYALSKKGKERRSQRKKLDSALTRLNLELELIPPVDDGVDMSHAARSFHQNVSGALLLQTNSGDDDVSKQRSVVLKACDDLRDKLRDVGLQVNDTVEKH